MTPLASKPFIENRDKGIGSEMKIISQGKQEYPFKILKADEHTCFTTGLKFELILNSPADTCDKLKVELMEWAYNKFYIIEKQKWLVAMINNDEVFSKSITIGGHTADVVAREVAKNSPIVQQCFPTDRDFIQDTSRAMRNKFIAVDVASLTIEKQDLNYEGD